MIPPNLRSNLLLLVPEYEVTRPYLSNANGEFVSHTLHERHAREIHDNDEWHYSMNAFGNKMHLKLRRNTQLVRPGLELETRHENGDVTTTPVSLNSYFHGRVSLDPDSLVAVSNANGLVRNSICFKNVRIYRRVTIKRLFYDGSVFPDHPP